MQVLKLGLIVASAFAGGAVTTLALNTAVLPALAQDGGKAPVVSGVTEPVGQFANGKFAVKSDSFELVDAEGKARARLGFDSDGNPGLWIADEKGNWNSETRDLGAGKRRALVDDLALKLMERPELTLTKCRVQHILISFKGAARSTQERSHDEAGKLAWDILEQLRKGGDIDALMKQHSNDPGPGIYTMVTDAAAAKPGEVHMRTGMVQAFGDVGWRLEVGEIGVASYDSQKSPFGYHIIKRLE